MPAPSQTTAQNINTELGRSSTASMNLNETEVRRLACKASGQISYGDCRWGINFPGGYMDQSTDYSTTYNTTDQLQLISSESYAFDGTTTASAASYIRFFSNGVMQLECTTSFVQKVYHKTWLTSGSAGDYTVQFLVTSGGLTSGTANTDLNMGTTRAFEVFASEGPSVGFESKNATGKIIIKDGGGTLIERPVTITATAEIII